MAKNLIRRYIWLIDTIRSCPNGITFEEINRKWQDSMINEYGDSMSKRTFHAHIEAILDEFDIEIACDRSDGYRYKIEDEFNEYGSIRSTLVDSLVLGNNVAEMPAMKTRICMSTSFAQKNIGILLKAIRKGCTVKITYVYDPTGKFLKHARANQPELSDCFKSANEPHYFEVETYGLTFHKFWFLICRNIANSEMCAFILDRLTDISLTDNKFTFPADFDIKQFTSPSTLTQYEEARFNRDSMICDDMWNLTSILKESDEGRFV